MRIWTEIAFCRDQTNKDLGFYYNEIIDKYEGEEYNDDWICLLDHDARFLTDKWYPTLESNILEHGQEVKLFTCKTNRVWCPYQKVEHLYTEDRNTEHKKYALSLERKEDPTKITILDDKSILLSGILMVFPCRTPVKFREIGECLKVDNYFHLDMMDNGYKVALIDNLYLYHWYRYDTENVNHLKNNI